MRGRHWIFSVALVSFVGLMSGADAGDTCEYSTPSYPDGERVCASVGDGSAVRSCLQNHLNQARESLNDAISDLKKFWETDDNDPICRKKEYEKNIKNFRESQKSWKKYVEKTCDTFLLEYWFPGSIYKTETIKCNYLLTKEREIILRILFKRQFEFIECRKK